MGWNVVYNTGTGESYIDIDGEYQIKYANTTYGWSLGPPSGPDVRIIAGHVEVPLDLTIENSGPHIFDRGSGLINNRAHMRLYSDDGLHLGVGLSDSSVNGNVIICNNVYVDSNFDHNPASSTPTLFIHSDEDPDVDNTEWLSLTHDGTNGLMKTGKGNLQILPTGFTQIGDATSTSHSLSANDDLLISGKCEIDGICYIDSTLDVANNARMEIGNAYLFYSTYMTPDCLFMGLSIESRNLVIGESSDYTYDYAHAQQTNPTVWIHSANQSGTEYVSISHNQTDGVIDCGTGTLNLGGTANVNFAGATRTASTVTHDSYVELEVAGVSYKFMLGS